MTKGYEGAPDNHLSSREPVRYGELDQDVIKGMTGFEFGTEEEIENRLGEILTSDIYLSALAGWDEKRGRSTSSTATPYSDRLGNITPSDFSLAGKSRSPNKRFSGIGFYSKKLAGNMAAAFSGKVEDGADAGTGYGSRSRLPQTIGAGGVKTDLTDPTRGYHPLLSIYFLVKEKLERDRIYGPGQFASSTLSLTGPSLPPQQLSSALPKGDSHAVPPKYDYSAKTPALNLLAPVPAATTLSRDTRTLQPPAARARPVDMNDNTPLAAYARPAQTAESSYMSRNGSQQKSRRGQNIPNQIPTSPTNLQGGFRRTAAPDLEPQPRLISHSSTPPQQRHSVHVDNRPTQQTGMSSDVTDANSNQEEMALSLPTSVSASGGFVKRFGSILGRSDDKRHSRQRNSISVSGQHSSSVQERPFSNVLSQDSDVPISPPQAGKGVSRASTTGSELSPLNKQHLRGTSVDATATSGIAHTASPRSISQSGERRRQNSTSGTASTRRPKTMGSVAFEDTVPEEGGASKVKVIQNSQEEAVNSSEGSSELKAVYLKVCHLSVKSISKLMSS